MTHVSPEMFSKNDAKLWTDEIDSIIRVFPSKVISELVTTFLISDFEFDTALIPCSTDVMGHLDIDIKRYIDVSTHKLVTKEYKSEWISVPLLPKINLGQNDLKVCLEVSGQDHCIFDLVITQNITNYHTFIISHSNPPIPMAVNVRLTPGKWILTTRLFHDHDSLFCSRLDDTQETIILGSYYKFHKATITACNTILIGVGFFPQTVKLLTCPTEKHPIWSKIDEHSHALYNSEMTGLYKNPKYDL